MRVDMLGPRCRADATQRCRCSTPVSSSISSSSWTTPPSGPSTRQTNLNFSSSFGTKATRYASSQDYDVATRFPIMDIMTFFPTVPFGRIQSIEANRVHIACLVPEVAEGSRARASVQDTLSRFNSTGGNETTGTASSVRVDMWKATAWVIGVMCVFAHQV
jgi:hypothetical protein